MARPKKSTAPIVGAGKVPEDKLTVQKSSPLLTLWRSDMTLAEFKILDTYLSRINSHDPERRTVLFTKGELEKLLGVKKINKAELSSRLNGLGRFVEVEQSDQKMHKVALFEEAQGEMDENGQWTVRMTCTAKAMKYVFNIEKLGYLRYKLRCITSLGSRYTYILFLYLESNRYRKSWEVSLEELREILNCDTEETYQEYKRFNDLVLKRCQKELHEKTECRYSYEPVKTGRRVTGIRFTLETLSDLLPASDEAQISFDDFDGYDEEDYVPPTEHEQVLDMLNAACDDEFTRDEMEVLFVLCCRKDIPRVHESTDLDKLHYLREKYALMKLRASKAPIQNRFSYFKAMIERDE